MLSVKLLFSQVILVSISSYLSIWFFTENRPRPIRAVMRATQPLVSPVLFYGSRALLLFPLMCHAEASPTTSTEIDSILQHLLDYLTGGPARLIAILSIVGVGYGTLFLGKIPKEKAIAVVAGIGIIFGGAAITNLLGI